ncbi:winged helix-turn-helix domain-containing protein [Helcobacillus massiliensis]|uniref:winged helix-turn-helix domain-containing protein n=1 Tax=Helcobacillus massiliensis TaxID=521392 RepID=UPI0021A55277|nr:winged helix-turn-helix domain-containing protein [Helcobacillus massiliensis]MCT1558441.1 winged helix-turn-helix domain-containing protein [Helcobacillus massiliensis]MCT2037011.1 winged helix-turn-helix domain-containing protein [Helcobacillus massiliensis]MCT2332704.1 winged helix-turn-helix domain-containing protein [Helcobacillus massiliensis]
MTITLDRPAAIRTVPTAATTARTGTSASRGSTTRTSSAGARALAPRRTAAQPAPSAPSDTVQITLTVELPTGVDVADTAAIADALRAQAQRLTTGRGGRASLSIDSPRPSARPRTFTTTPGQDSAAPLRPRRTGVVSANAPARRDAEAARLRLLRAAAVSPSSPASPSAAPQLRADGLVIDLYGRRVRIDGEDVDFSYKEFELLAFLTRSARTVVSRDALMENVWADAAADTGERTVDVHIRRVRNKLGRYRRLISTVRGAGYRLDPGSDVTVLQHH